MFSIRKLLIVLSLLVFVTILLDYGRAQVNGWREPKGIVNNELHDRMCGSVESLTSISTLFSSITALRPNYSYMHYPLCYDGTIYKTRDEHERKLIDKSLLEAQPINPLRRYVYDIKSIVASEIVNVDKAKIPDECKNYSAAIRETLESYENDKVITFVVKCRLKALQHINKEEDLAFFIIMIYKDKKYEPIVFCEYTAESK